MPSIPIITAQRTGGSGAFMPTPRARASVLTDQLSQLAGQQASLAAQREHADAGNLAAVTEAGIVEQLEALKAEVTHKEYADRAKALVDERLGEAGNDVLPGGSQAWKRYSEDIRARQGMSAAKYVAEQTRSTTVANWKKASNARANLVRVNPDAFDQYAREAGDLIQVQEGIDAATKTAWLRDEVYALGVAAANGKITGVATSQGAKAVEQELRTEKWQQRMPAPQYDTILKMAANRVRDLEKQETAAISNSNSEMLLQMNWEFQDLMREVKAGRAGQTEVTAWREKFNGIREAAGKWGQLQGEVDVNLKRMQAIGRVQDVMLGVGVLSPNDADDTQAVEWFFDASLDGARKNGASFEDVRELTLATIKNTGVVPKQVKRSIEGGLANPAQPEAMVQAALTLAEIEAVAGPAVKAQFNRNQVSLAEELRMYVDNGASPDEAVELQQRRRDVGDDVRKHRNAAFKADTDTFGDDAVASKLSDAFDPGFFSGAPDIPPGMLVDAKEQLRAEFEAHGNAEAAWATTTKLMKRKWGPDPVNGKSLGAFPVTRMYAVPGLTEAENERWIRQDLARTVAGTTIGPELDPERLILTPSATRKALDGRPVYVVGLVNAGGVAELGITYAPAWEQSDMYAQEKQARQALRDGAARGEYIKTADKIRRLRREGMVADVQTLKGGR